MFVYLSKKVNIGNGVKATCSAWSRQYNTIAVGCDDGHVRTLATDSVVTQKALTVKQQLSGHGSSLTGCVWNDTHCKLTTADASGLIIVWISDASEWKEEMVNNRGKMFAVSGLTWSPDGSMIAILYEDGAMILGSADGTRLWEKEFRVMCRNVQWSPDSKVLLVGVGEEVQAFDEHGASRLCMRNKKRPLTVARLHSSREAAVQHQPVIRCLCRQHQVVLAQQRSQSLLPCTGLQRRLRATDEARD